MPGFRIEEFIGRVGQDASGAQMQCGGPRCQGAEGGRRRGVLGGVVQAGPGAGAGPAVEMPVDGRPERALRAGRDPGGGMGGDGEDAVQPVAQGGVAAAGEERREGGPFGGRRGGTRGGWRESDKVPAARRQAAGVRMRGEDGSCAGLRIKQITLSGKYSFCKRKRLSASVRKPIADPGLIQTAPSSNLESASDRWRTIGFKAVRHGARTFAARSGGTL